MPVNFAKNRSGEREEGYLAGTNGKTEKAEEAVITPFAAAGERESSLENVGKAKMK